MTITDPGGLTATSSVSVTVNQLLTSISNAGQPPLAMVLDQFGNPLVNQPAFNVSLDTITGSLVFDSSEVVLPAASSVLTISGSISGEGGLTVGAAGTVVLSGANSYSGGTTIAAGTLVATQSSAIAAATSLTVGAGRGLRFRPIVAVEYRVQRHGGRALEPHGFNNCRADCCERGLVARSLFSSAHRRCWEP